MFIGRHVDDVDLFPGGMVEQLVPGALVGPTFACMLAKQFEALKKADRFWFESCSGKHKFTKGIVTKPVYLHCKKYYSIDEQGYF